MLPMSLERLPPVAGLNQFPCLLPAGGCPRHSQPSPGVCVAGMLPGWEIEGVGCGGVADIWQREKEKSDSVFFNTIVV